MTEFEKHLFAILDAYNGIEIDVKAAVEINAPVLFELARKELMSKCIYGRSLEEMRRSCQFCSAICGARLPRESSYASTGVEVKK